MLEHRFPRIACPRCPSGPTKWTRSGSQDGPVQRGFPNIGRTPFSTNRMPTLPLWTHQRGPFGVPRRPCTKGDPRILLDRTPFSRIACARCPPWHFWRTLGALLAHPGALLAHPGGTFGASWEHFWRTLGALLAHPGSTFGAPWGHFWRTQEALRRTRDTSWAPSGCPDAFGAHPGPSPPPPCHALQ